MAKRRRENLYRVTKIPELRRWKVTWNNSENICICVGRHSYQKARRIARLLNESEKGE